MIKIDHLYFSYTGQQPYLLNDINLEIADGEYISIIGENGCGKTTLMRVMLKLLKPTKGMITISSGSIGYVPQKNDFNNANFPITVYEVMNSYRKLRKIKNKDIIHTSLKLVGMEDATKSLMGRLSGGQVQKILIARAMMGDPDLLILDEPSTGIDVDSQREIYGILKSMNQNKKMTIVAVEHNLDAVIANSTKIFHIQNGHGHLCNLDKYTEEYLKRKERTGFYASI